MVLLPVQEARIHGETFSAIERGGLTASPIAPAAFALGSNSGASLDSESPEVPEPATWGLAGVGIVLMAARCVLRKRL